MDSTTGAALAEDYAVALAYAVAMLIGAAAAVSELASRYKDAPLAAATSRAGVTYILFNALVSLLAMYLIRVVFPIHDAVDGAPPADLRTLAVDVLIAGFGAMAALRSSVVTVKSGGADVPIGFAAVVQIFRDTLDRDVDRVRAGPRATEVGGIMSDVSFVRAYEPLSSVSISLLQNIPAEEEARLRQRIGALANQTGRSDADKALELGLILAGSVGFAVLKEAKALLGSKIDNGSSRPTVVSGLIANLPLEVILRDLPSVCLALNTSVPADDQNALSSQIDLIAQSRLSRTAKAVNAGMVLANSVGEDTLASAIDLLTKDAPKPGAGGGIDSGRSRPSVVSDLIANLPPEVILRDLPPVCLTLNASMSANDQTALSSEIDLIEQSRLSPAAKAVSAAMVLANIFGEETLAAAIDLLTKDAPKPGAGGGAPAPRLASPPDP